LTSPPKHASLDGGADSNHLIRIDALVGSFLVRSAHQVLDHGHAGCTADQDHFVDLAGVHAGIFEAALNGPRRRSTRSSVSCSNLEREGASAGALGPEASAVM
jgi:hypothetical protein